MKVSISDAARLAGISRQHLYSKYIKPGLITVDRNNPDKPVIDTAELIRVFGEIQLPDSPVSSDGQELIGELSSKLTALDRELQATREQLTAAQDREKWLQSTVDKLTDTIRQIEHKPALEQALEPARRSWLTRIFGRA